MIRLFFEFLLILTKIFLAFNFDMKDNGEADTILGVEIIRCEKCPDAYARALLERLITKFGHHDANPILTPN